MTNNTNCKSAYGEEVTTSSILQRFETAELLESCRAHASSMAELADATAKGLSAGYRYEDHEPHLDECCGLICCVLQQTESVLSALGVVSLEEPRSGGIGAACADQEQWLKGSAHSVRSVMSILRSVEPEGHLQLLPALGDLECGIWMLVEGLKAIAQRESRT